MDTGAILIPLVLLLLWIWAYTKPREVFGTKYNRLYWWCVAGVVGSSGIVAAIMTGIYYGCEGEYCSLGGAILWLLWTCIVTLVTPIILVVRGYRGEQDKKETNKDRTS